MHQAYDFKLLLRKTSHFAFVCVVLVIALYVNQDLLRSAFYPVADYAADMLWANVIRESGILLVGHYSRYDFNHPGPFWFYWNIAWEYALRGLGFTRFQEWLIGSIVLNISCLLFAGWALSRYLFGVYKTYVSLVLFVTTLFLAGGHLFGLWMPLRLITPYIAFLIVLLHITDGNLKFLPALVILGGLLFHGYLTSAVAIFPIAGCCLLIGFARGGGSFLRSSRGFRSAGLAIFLLLIFLLPIIWDMRLSENPNLFRILKAQQATNLMPTPSWADLWTFYWQLLFNQASSTFVYSLFLCASLILFAMHKLSAQAKIKLRLIPIFLLFLASSILLVIFYKTTPAPIYVFTAQFFVGASALLVTAVLCQLIASAQTTLRFKELTVQGIFVLMMCGSMFLVVRYGTVNSVPEHPDKQMSSSVPKLTNSLLQKFEGGLAIAHHDRGIWGLVAGLLIESEKQGRLACVSRPDMAFLYTARKVCENSRKPDIYVVDIKDCRDKCFATDARWGLLTPE
jgi:hypothetical protein